MDVPQAELDELRSRLARTRWPASWTIRRWEGGADAAELQRLVEYWRTDYDWRAQESAINALDSGFAVIDGTRCTSCASTVSIPTPCPSC